MNSDFSLLPFLSSVSSRLWFWI